MVLVVGIVVLVVVDEDGTEVPVSGIEVVVTTVVVDVVVDVSGVVVVGDGAVVSVSGGEVVAVNVVGIPAATGVSATRSLMPATAAEAMRTDTAVAASHATTITDLCSVAARLRLMSVSLCFMSVSLCFMTGQMPFYFFLVSMHY